MPRPLAQWIIEKLGFKDLRDFSPSPRPKRHSGRSKSRHFDAKTRSAAAPPNSDELNDPELTAAIEKMGRRNSFFLRVWNNEPPDPGKDGSRSGRLLCLAKICLGFGYQEAFAIRLAQHWCHRHGKSFDARQWIAIFRHASWLYTEDQKKRHANHN
jgi:hypothetical protein